MQVNIILGSILKSKVIGFDIEPGDRVHLTTRNGIYTVTGWNNEGVFVTCNRWNALQNYPKIPVTRLVAFKEIKCREGVPGKKELNIKLKASLFGDCSRYINQ